MINYFFFFKDDKDYLAPSFYSTCDNTHKLLWLRLYTQAAAAYKWIWKIPNEPKNRPQTTDGYKLSSRGGGSQAGR